MIAKVKSCLNVIILHSTQLDINVHGNSYVFNLVCLCLPWGSYTSCLALSQIPFTCKGPSWKHCFVGVFILIFCLDVKISVKIH